MDRLRHFVVAFLFIVFISPYPIKLADVVIHHHYTSHYTQNRETAFDISGNVCPIPGFKFQSFIFQDNLPVTEGIRYLHKIPVFRTQNPFSTRYFLSFSLRAPPLLDNISSEKQS